MDEDRSMPSLNETPSSTVAKKVDNSPSKGHTWADILNEMSIMLSIGAPLMIINSLGYLMTLVDLAMVHLLTFDPLTTTSFF